MEKADFLVYLNSRVQDFKKAWNLDVGKAFGMWLLTEYMELEEDEAFEACSFDGGNDKDIDIFHVDHETERVVVGQLKFKSKGDYVGKKAELLSLLHTTDWLKDPEALSRDGRKDLESAARDYLDATGAGYSVEYVYAYCGAAAKDVIDAARQFNVASAESPTSSFCRVFDLPTLKTIHEEHIDQSTRVPEATISLSQDAFFEEKGAYGTALVATVSGAELKALHDTYGDRLFDRNVRLFLGARKGGVNAGIAATLESPSDRQNFWAYNNGVTFICDAYEISDDSIALKNFSIVNGCQTTVSLANSAASAASAAKVLTRFIAAPEKVIDSIITYTNSQNPIRLWDLSAQDKLQKKLKRDLAKLPNPFLYVLRKGETRQLTADEKKKYRSDGKLRAIPHDLNAQYLGAFKGMPSIAYKDKGKVFSVHRDEVFPPQTRAEEVVLAWQAGSVARELVRTELQEALDQNDELRSEILKRGSTFFILAVMGVLLHERNGKTFLNTLKPEVATSNATAHRLRNYATVALEWYVEIMSELLETGGTVATLVRTREGWNKIRPKVVSKWKVYQLSKELMQSALPKL